MDVKRYFNKNVSIAILGYDLMITLVTFVRNKSLKGANFKVSDIFFSL